MSKVYTIEELQQLATETAARHGLDPSIFVSMIAVESSFDVNARDYATGTHYGLGQIGTAAVQDVGGDIGQVFDPVANLEYSARYLKMLLDKFGNYPDALRAYNVGPTGAANNRAAGSGYSSKVMGGSASSAPAATKSFGAKEWEKFKKTLQQGNANTTPLGQANASATSAVSNVLWGWIVNYGNYAAMIIVIVLATVLGIYAIVSGENLPSPKGAIGLVGKLK